MELQSERAQEPIVPVAPVKTLDSVMLSSLPGIFNTLQKDPTVAKHAECYGRGYVGRNYVPPKSDRHKGGCNGVVLCTCMKKLFPAALTAELEASGLPANAYPPRGDTYMSVKDYAATVIKNGILYGLDTVV